jgi:hypothetical protein
MASSGMLRPVTLVRTDDSISSERARLLVTANVRSSPILVNLMFEAPRSSETSVLQEPHGVASQKAIFFIVTAVETSNLTQH